MGAPKSLSLKLEAAIAWLVSGGSSKKASNLLGYSGNKKRVADRTIREWTELAEWPDLVHKAKEVLQDDLDAAETEIIHKAVGKIVERLDKGDPYVKKDQTVGYKPMTGKDTTMVLAIMSDKRAMIRGEPTRRTETVKESDRLDTIKKRLSAPLEETEDKPPKGLENLH